MKTEMTTGFDYESVDENTAGKLRYFATEGRKLIRQNVESIAKMGELLFNAQQQLASHHNGTFVKWAVSEFDISQKTVYNYVNAWSRLLCNGYTTYQNLSPTAIYLLTAEDTPKPIQKKVAHLAAQQEPVRKADIQRLIDASKPKPPSKTPEQAEESTELMREVVETAKATAQRTGQPVVSQVAAQLDTVDAYQAASEESQGKADARADKPEPVNSLPAWKLQRSKAKKTAEALMRALQDLNDIRPITFVKASVDDCLAIISELEAMR